MLPQDAGGLVPFSYPMFCEMARSLEARGITMGDTRTLEILVPAEAFDRQMTEFQDLVSGSSRHLVLCEKPTVTGNMLSYAVSCGWKIILHRKEEALLTPADSLQDLMRDSLMEGRFLQRAIHLLVREVLELKRQVVKP